MRDRFPGEESAGISLADSPKTAHLLPHNHPQLLVSLRQTAPVRSFPLRSILLIDITEIQPFKESNLFDVSNSSRFMLRLSRPW